MLTNGLLIDSNCCCLVIVTNCCRVCTNTGTSFSGCKPANVKGVTINSYLILPVGENPGRMRWFCYLKDGTNVLGRVNLTLKNRIALIAPECADLRVSKPRTICSDDVLSIHDIAIPFVIGRQCRYNTHNCT